MQCSETNEKSIFWFLFFLDIIFNKSEKFFSHFKRIYEFFFVWISFFEIWSICIQQWLTENWGLTKNLVEIFANLIQTLTSEARVLNPKACGVKGYSSSPNFFFNQMNKMFFDTKFQKWSYIHERCGMCYNEWKINFPSFCFWGMVVFLIKIF